MQGFKKIGFGFFDLYSGELKLPVEVRDFIYEPYVLHLERCSKLLPGDYVGPRMHKYTRLIRTVLRVIKRKFYRMSNVYRLRANRM